MAQARLPSSPIPSLHTVELTREFEPKLQRFFDANPEYFHAVLGEPARPGEAHNEIHGELPAGWTFTKKWLLGYVDAHESLAAMANIVSDLLTPGVWHVGLFIVATSRRGTGQAQLLYRSLEEWAASNGATWLRLGVVQGNARAERFWESMGYIQTRTRSGVEMGKLMSTLRVMVKPLGNDTLEHYLSLVPRDSPRTS